MLEHLRKINDALNRKSMTKKNGNGLREKM